MNYYLGMTCIRQGKYTEAVQFMEFVIKIAKYEAVSDKVFYKRFAEKARGEMPGLSIQIKASTSQKGSSEDEKQTDEIKKEE